MHTWNMNRYIGASLYAINIGGLRIGNASCTVPQVREVTSCIGSQG